MRNKKIFWICGDRNWRIATENRKYGVNGRREERTRGRERSDLDDCPQQPAGDGDMRVTKEKPDGGGEGGKRVDDQIAERAIESGMEGERRRRRTNEERQQLPAEHHCSRAAHLQTDAITVAVTDATSAERTLQADQSECCCYF